MTCNLRHPTRLRHPVTVCERKWLWLSLSLYVHAPMLVRVRVRACACVYVRVCVCEIYRQQGGGRLTLFVTNTCSLVWRLYMCSFHYVHGQLCMRFSTVYVNYGVCIFQIHSRHALGEGRERGGGSTHFLALKKKNSQKTRTKQAISAQCRDFWRRLWWVKKAVRSVGFAMCPRLCAPYHQYTYTYT